MNNNLLRRLAVFSIIGGIFQTVATFGFGYQYQWVMTQWGQL